MPCSTPSLTWVFAPAEVAAPCGGRKVNEWLDDRGVLCAEAFSRDDLNWIDWVDIGIFAFSEGSSQVRVWPRSSARREAIHDAFSRMLQPILRQAMGWL